MIRSETPGARDHEHQPVPQSSPAVPTSPHDLQESRHEHQPCARIRRGPAPEAALSALPRGEGQGGARADHVRRVVEHRTGLAFRVRPDLHRRRLHHPRAPGVLRARAPPRLRHHVPDHAHGAPHAVERGGLAAARRAFGRARARAPFLPKGDGPQRHPAGGACVRRCRVALQGGRPRRHRAPRPGSPYPPVLDAARQPAHRRVRRQPRESGPVRPGSSGGDTTARGRRLPGRIPDDGRRAQGRRPQSGGLPRAGEVLRRHRHVRLHERDRGAGR